VFCQLDTLRQCLPQSVRRTLTELPKSLDGTYERVIMEIKSANQAHAYRMLQCLAVATRPLSVAELAELLAFDFDVAKGGTPKLNSDWRWGDHEEAVLSTCSSLVTVVPGRNTSFVQFSHFSVKEFLMSDRLATSTGDISQYHISLSASHTVLAQACLGVLLRDPDLTNGTDNAPLAGYAARYWVVHAHVENVTSRVRGGMQILFSPDKPYFEAWVKIHDVDEIYFSESQSDPHPEARRLYYAAMCGFQELVEHLILKYPQHASAHGGRCGTALHSASISGHLHVVQLLLRHGVSVDVQNCMNDTPLLLASMQGHRDVVQYLLDYGADVNLQGSSLNSPLNWAAYRGDIDIVRMLLEHNADVNSKDDTGSTPLHDALRYYSKGGYPQVVRLLLEHGADTKAQDSRRWTPLHHMAIGQLGPDLDVARMLLEYSTDVDVEDEDGMTPLQLALAEGQVEIAQLLSEFRSKTQT
jgi:ankyrin repeat protein